MSRPRIFVVIVSYRDPECQWTIRDLFRKARHPERVSVGVCWQTIPSKDWHCGLIKTRPEQVRERFFDARSSRGLCWARGVAHSLRQGEEYTLQIDSHMRFHADWDEELLALLSSCPSPKPVVSVYPASYEPPAELTCSIARMVPDGEDRYGIPKFLGAFLAGEELTECKAPMPSAFLAGGFMFARSALFEEVPYDPHVFNGGDEMSFTVRAWTAGWDPFAPQRCIIHHFYGRQGYPHLSDDMPDWIQLEVRSVARTRVLLGLDDPATSTSVVTESELGLGNVRSLKEYYQYAGISLPLAS